MHPAGPVPTMSTSTSSGSSAGRASASGAAGRRSGSPGGSRLDRTARRSPLVAVGQGPAYRQYPNDSPGRLPHRGHHLSPLSGRWADIGSTPLPSNHVGPARSASPIGQRKVDAVMFRRALVGAATILACTGFAASAHAASPLYVSLTFDDGLSSDVSFVLPALQQHGMTGTFYINSSNIGSAAAYMTWDDVATLQSAGMEIGGHTLTHANLVDVWNDPAYTTDAERTAAVQAQVCPDRQAIVSHGIVPTGFAYPNGGWKIDDGSQYATAPPSPPSSRGAATPTRARPRASRWSRRTATATSATPR